MLTLTCTRCSSPMLGASELCDGCTRTAQIETIERAMLLWGRVGFDAQVKKYVEEMRELEK